MAAGCWRAPAARSGPTSIPAAVQATFAGNEACGECHASEVNSHSRSAHAHTLRLLSHSGMGRLAPPPGNVPHTDYVLSAKDDQYVVGLPGNSDDVAPMEYALGSGKTGITFTSVVGGNRLAEFRMSWFPTQQKWYVTPGAETLESEALGRVHSPEDARKCFLCHVVTLPADKPVPEKRFFGVGCESCHGPGSAHIAAMRSGKYPDEQLQRLERWPASRLNDLCGKCHGTEQDVQLQHLPASLTNRMQAYGLTQSRCFKQSNDSLSCISCHDPHIDASTDKTTYEAVCLTCHSAAAPANPPPHVHRTAGKPCPVNPKTGCIGCHMPARPAIPGSALPTLMTDHFIRRRP